MFLVHLKIEKMNSERRNVSVAIFSVWAKRMLAGCHAEVGSRECVSFKGRLTRLVVADVGAVSSFRFMDISAFLP